MIAIGFVLLAAGFVVLATLSPGDGYPRLVVALVVMGAGSGMAGPAVYGTLLGALPPDRAGVGSAVNDTVQQVGQALSVAVLGSVLTAAYGAAMPDDVTGPARHSLGDALGVAAARGDVALAATARTAFVHAMATIAIVGVFGAVAAAVLAFSVLRPAPRTAPEAVPDPVPGGPASPAAGAL